MDGRREEEEEDEEGRADTAFKKTTTHQCGEQSSKIWKGSEVTRTSCSMEVLCNSGEVFPASSAVDQKLLRLQNESFSYIRLSVKE